MNPQLASLHSTLTSVSFFAAATFHLSSTTLSSASHLSQALLSTLDAILGCSESSKAIAAIVTLIRREFRRSDQEHGTEQVGIGDLLVGTVGFAMLQRWGRKNTESELHGNGGDEAVWDVIVLDNGIRADVIGTRQLDIGPGIHDDLDDQQKRASFMSLMNDDGDIGAIERPKSAADSLNIVLSPEQQHHISDEDLRLYIMSQLPRGCRASIRTETISARTITVDILDDENAEISAPPGTKMIAESFHRDEDHMSDTDRPVSQRQPKHTVVFRTAFNKEQSADVISQAGRDTGFQSNETWPGPEGVDAIDGPISAWVADTKMLTDNDHEADVHDGSLVHDIPDDQRAIEVASPSQVSEDDHPKEIQSEASSRVRVKQGDTGAAVRSNKTGGSSNARSRNGPDNHKNSLRRSTLAKLAHRVKQNGGEKMESRKRGPSQKNSDESPSSLPISTTQPNRASTGPGPVKGNVQQQRPPHGPNKPKRHQEATPSANRPAQSTVPDRRGSVRASLPSNVKPVRSSNARHVQPRNPASPDYFALREKNRESFLAQKDAYSIVSGDGRPGSSARGHVRSSSAISITRSDAEMTLFNGDTLPTSTSGRRRSSAISIATAGSENNSLILAPRRRSNVHEDTEMIRDLHRDGFFPGIFPEKHLVRNVRRFCRFSAASYGPSALKMMGVRSTADTIFPEGSDNHEHSGFTAYAGLPPSSILLSSFVDPEGGSNAAGETETGFPLVHYLCIDHESKAVVLTLRGTWGFEDVLTDMTCDYDDIEYLGRSWKVHKGMHASAKRLLQGGSGRVMITIRAALDEYPDYGVVFCGHSLGGGVAALLATMISVPNDDTSGTSFVTASHESALLSFLPVNGGDHDEKFPRPSYFLPPGRPIHVYAYGPPAVMSPLLRRATRGLITTVVNGQDMVPSLSLGILHDMHAVSVAFKGDASSAKSQIRNRFWEGLRESIINKFYVDQPPMLLYAGDGIGEDAWAWKTLNMLREEMRSPKLVPPGEVFVVDTVRVLQRDPFTSTCRFAAHDSYPHLGRPATRVQLRFIRSVESWFGELRFGSGMFADHNPARYEANIAALSRGVLDF